MTQPIFFDTETEPTRHDKAYPRCSVAAVAYGDQPVTLYTPAEAAAQIQMRVDAGAPLVGHNVHYDIAALKLRIPDWSKVYDTSIRGVLRGAANGQHEAASSGLKDLARPLGYTLKKGPITLSFGSVYGPADCTPEQAEYAIEDVLATRDVFTAQGGLTRCSPDEVFQTHVADDVFHMARRGVPVDERRVQMMCQQADEQINGMRPDLIGAGIIQARGPKRDPWRDEAVDDKTVQRLLEESGATRKGGTRKRPGKKLAADEEALVASGNPALAKLAAYKSAQKWSGLCHAFDVQGPWIRAWWKSMVASGRLGCGHPNLTQVPRLGGLRECIKAPEGYALVTVDYAALEFRVWAATCEKVLGWSRAAQTLRAGLDPHLLVAAEILGLTINEATALYALGDKRVKAARQDAKAVNYGCIGGMGAARLSKQFTDAGRPCTLQEAQDIIDAWVRTFPEAAKYQQWLKTGWAGNGMYRVKLPWSGRERLAFYPEAANFMIQGGGADVAKYGLRLLAEDGVPIIMLGHDEYVALVPQADAGDVGRLIVTRCEEAGREVYPQVPWNGQKFDVVERWPSK